MAKAERKPRPLGERLEAARSSTMDSLTCELAYAAIFASRQWPSFLCAPDRKDARFPYVLCIDSPAGRLAYKVTDAEVDAMLKHVQIAPNDGVMCSKADRLARLMHLATEGYK